ncbi:MAG: hypothetical protein LBR10_13410 [Prevotellaceae bacterium]|jgi:hypothetical protein|nr:hypothetical protein [Prevotellaceae bacterium]
MWKASKYINILLWVLAIISVVLCGYVFVKCGNLSAVSQREEMVSVINPIFVWSYILVGITALLAILLPVPQVIKSPKSALGIFVGLVGLAIVIVLSILFANGDQLPFTPGHDPVSESTIKFADMNIISIYIILGAAILVTLVTSVVNIIKQK